MTVSNMRRAIAEVYSGPNWKYRVDRMSASQVMAIYFSFIQRGLLGG